MCSSTGIEESARLLGVAVGEQFHGALHVGEEHGDLLSFPCQRMARRQDPLGQVPRGVALGGRGGWTRGRGGPRHRLAALIAEARARRIRVLARRAESLQATAAAIAELRPRRIVLTTLCAVHEGLFSEGGPHDPSLTSMISSAIAPWASRCTAAAASLLGAWTRQNTLPVPSSYQYRR